MASSKACLWITLAFCAVVGSQEIYKKKRQEVIMDSGDADNSKYLEWKHNDKLIFKITSRTGVPSKGSADVARKAQLAGTKLKIPSLDMGDSGIYSFTGYEKTGQKITRQYLLHVVSVSVSPSERVLHNTDVTLSCDIGEDSSAQVQWLKPPHDQPYRDSGKVITLKSVTSEDAGQWTCLIKDEKGTMLEKFPVDISVVGPLLSIEDVTVPQRSQATLACSLRNPSNLDIVKGGWARNPPVSLPTFNRINGEVNWNKTHVKSGVTVNEKQFTNLTLTFKKVESADAGKYICFLEFNNGRNLSAKITLNVEAAGDVSGVGSGPMDKQVFGVELWVWVAVATALVFLTVLVVVIVLIYRRNKRMRRKVRKLKSMRQPLTARHFCQCERPHPGRKQRPPPLPRHQYDVMSRHYE